MAIIGGRDFGDYDLLDKKISKLTRNCIVQCIVSGGAKGADTLGGIYARRHKIPLQVFRPNWKQHGRSAGFIRNHLIINSATHVVAFWDGKSKGTKHSIDLAIKAKKVLRIIRYSIPELL